MDEAIRVIKKDYYAPLARLLIRTYYPFSDRV